MALSERKQVITATDVAMTYTAQDGSPIPALGPLSLSIRDREFVSVVGPSGCGKSTLLKIVAGLIQPTGGVAAVNGETVTEPTGRVGVVFQTPVLLPWKSVLQNVLLPVAVKRKPTDADHRRAMDLLALVGLQDFARRHPHELSGGMQQRAGIVRALVDDPDILLMDEPFGALDAITRDQMNVELLAIWERTRKTVLFITHGISEAVFLSDRVVVLSARPGQIIEDCAIDLPRPREVRQTALPRFGEITGHIRVVLERGTPARHERIALAQRAG